MPTCDDAWSALEANYKELMDCLGRLTEDELTSSPACGVWTVKDVIAHIWVWTDLSVETIRVWPETRTRPPSVTYDDAWNEEQVADRAALPLITVVDGAGTAHRRLMHQLDVTPEEDLAVIGIAPWGEEMTLLAFFLSMAGHYSDHVADLRSYQDKCLDGCP